MEKSGLVSVLPAFSKLLFLAVVSALTEGRHAQLDNLEPVVEILTEVAPCDCAGQVTVG